MNQNSCRFSELHGKCGKHAHRKTCISPISGNKNTLINVQCCISNTTCQPTLLLFYHSCTFIVFEHCLSPSQHSSCCLPLCPIFAFSPCKCHKCVMRVVFQPAKPASTPWRWHFTFDSAPWNPARFPSSHVPRLPPPAPPSRGQVPEVTPVTSRVTPSTPMASTECYWFQWRYKLYHNTAW